MDRPCQKRRSGERKGSSRVVKINHKLATNSAWWIAARVEGKESGEDSPEKYLAAAPKYVAEQYSGKKEALRPVYENVLQVAAKLGADVKACPGKTILPLHRNHVFAQLRPTTNTRLDLGLSLTHSKESCRNACWIPVVWQRKTALPTGSN
jgi:hypothetical protein